jgi:hypothetical protein
VPAARRLYGLAPIRVLDAYDIAPPQLAACTIHRDDGGNAAPAARSAAGDERRATSDERRATSDERRATSDASYVPRRKHPVSDGVAHRGDLQVVLTPRAAAGRR